MNKQKKIDIAEGLVEAYKETIKPQNIRDNRDALFGVIVNTENELGETLVEKFGEEDAYHITNIVLQKLEQRIIGDF